MKYMWSSSRRLKPLTVRLNTSSSLGLQPHRVSSAGLHGSVSGGSQSTADGQIGSLLRTPTSYWYMQNRWLDEGMFPTMGEILMGSRSMLPTETIRICSSFSSRREGSMKPWDSSMRRSSSVKAGMMLSTSKVRNCVDSFHRPMEETMRYRSAPRTSMSCFESEFRKPGSSRIRGVAGVIFTDGCSFISSRKMLCLIGGL
mmetsp:Transcript_44875/g.116269  ORF Transcript_44875/g.116269 Transcript_44875/m.116269 type:complete len:200 (-) Transcript_44875:2969-3568(-)